MFPGQVSRREDQKRSDEFPRGGLGLPTREINLLKPQLSGLVKLKARQACAASLRSPVQRTQYRRRRNAETLSVICLWTSPSRSNPHVRSFTARRRRGAQCHLSEVPDVRSRYSSSLRELRRAATSLAIRVPARTCTGSRLDIAVSLLPLRQCRLIARQLLVRDLLQKVGDDVQPGAPLVVGAHDMPRRPGGVGGLEHVVARARIVVPAAVGLEVHRR